MGRVACAPGVLPVLQGREGGLPYSAVVYAARAGCTATVEGLVGEDMHQELVDLWGEVVWYSTAARMGDRGMLECLKRLGLALRQGVVREAVLGGAPLPALRWLVEQGAPVGEEEVQSTLEGLDEMHQGTEEERREVEAWLRGLLGAGDGGVP